MVLLSKANSVGVGGILCSVVSIPKMEATERIAEKEA
jgi:hypothetical protein